jgi:catechol 2,3-dioxygenase
MTSARPIDPATRIGHVHPKVADLERALGFYRDVLGFEVTQRMGSEAVFLSASGYHHHIGLEDLLREVDQGPSVGEPPAA